MRCGRLASWCPAGTAASGSGRGAAGRRSSSAATSTRPAPTVTTTPLTRSTARPTAPSACSARRAQTHSSSVFVCVLRALCCVVENVAHSAARGGGKRHRHKLSRVRPPGAKNTLHFQCLCLWRSTFSNTGVSPTVAGRGHDEAPSHSQVRRSAPPHPLSCPLHRTHLSRRGRAPLRSFGLPVAGRYGQVTPRDHARMASHQLRRRGCGGLQPAALRGRSQRDRRFDSSTRRCRRRRRRLR